MIRARGRSVIHFYNQLGIARRDKGALVLLGVRFEFRILQLRSSNSPNGNLELLVLKIGIPSLFVIEVLISGSSVWKGRWAMEREIVIEEGNGFYEGRRVLSKNRFTSVIHGNVFVQRRRPEPRNRFVT